MHELYNTTVIECGIKNSTNTRKASVTLSYITDACRHLIKVCPKMHLHHHKSFPICLCTEYYKKKFYYTYFHYERKQLHIHWSLLQDRQ